MTDLRRDYHKTEKPRLDHLVQMIIEELLDAAVYLLVGRAEQEKSQLMLSVAIDLLKNNADYKVLYIKAPTGLFFGHITLHDDINTPFLPEYWSLYQWLFQAVGEETAREWLSCGRLTVVSTEDFNDLVIHADVVLLDEIHHMNAKTVHQLIETHCDQQKIIMTYESENAIFTDLVINEFESLLSASKPDSKLKFMLIGTRESEVIRESSKLENAHMFEHMNLSKMDMDVIAHDRKTHLIFDIKDNIFELRDTEEPESSEGELKLEDLSAEVIKVEPIHVKPELALVADTAFWGNGANNSYDALLASANRYNGSLVEEEVELQEIVMEKVSSDFWGDYKVHVLQALTVYEPEPLDWKYLRKSPREEAKNKEKEARLQLSLESQNRYLVGKLVGANLFDSNQKIIARKGDVITSEIIEKATLSNVLVELILNMTLPELEGTYE